MTLTFIIYGCLGLLTLCHMQLVLTCRSGTPQECEHLDFVPGHNLIGEGFDIVTLEHKGAYVVKVDNVQTSSNSCTVCRNYLQKSTLQKIPQGTVDWRILSSCRKDFKTSTFSTASSVTDSITNIINNDWKVGLNLQKIGGFQLAGSKSNVYSFASSYLNEDQATFMSHSFTCTHYSLRLSRDVQLSYEFQRDVQTLPQEFLPNTTEQYQHFIDIYGTHYLYSVRLGGRFRRVTAIRMCLATLNKFSVSHINDCLSVGLSLSFGLCIQLDTSFSQCKGILSNVDSVTGYKKGFLEHITEINGGNGWNGEAVMEEGSSQDFKEWRSSLKKLPGIVSYKLHPLNKLVQDRQISRNLKSAIEEYVAKNAKIKTEAPVCKLTSPNLSPDCCPLLRGRGRLVIQIHRGFSLKCKFNFLQSDAFVKMICGNQYKETHTIRSYDPLWFSFYDFGFVDTHGACRLEVWDRDWPHDLEHGAYNVDLMQGEHGHYVPLHRNGVAFAFSYTLTCDHHLTGRKCDHYSPSSS